MQRRPLPAPLTRHLARLRFLAGSPAARPIFDEMEDAIIDATERTEATGKRHLVTPVWAIDHDNLDESEPTAWSWTVNIV